jgi:hypothetical protein
MGFEAVVPVSEAVESGLHGIGDRQQRRPSCPSFDVRKNPLDLRVEVPGPDLAAHVGDPQLPHRCAKLPAELAPVIGYEVPGSRSRFVGRVLRLRTGFVRPT